jgi:hypothetical protein
VIYESSNGRLINGFRHRFTAKDLAEIQAFLETGDRVVPLREVARGDTDERAIAMRHDVDHNLDHAIKMAEWEHTHGFRSTYFVLHTAWYYRDKPKLYGGLQRLVNLGHEVGLHTNVMVEAKARGSEGNNLWLHAADLLFDELTELRRVGFEIVGTASHGDPRCKQLGVLNMDIWNAYKPTDFGLEYEAYLLHRKPGAYYVSESHGKWHGERELKPGKQTQMLVHPCHWNLERALEQRSKNTQRRVTPMPNKQRVTPGGYGGQISSRDTRKTRALVSREKNRFSP